jgi:DNA mismatch endonuclease (patch repair protein)
MDIVDSVTRSRMMGNIKSRDTQPELALRRALHARGFRFRLHRKDLPGSPDIVLPRFKVAIFVHGCFWHRHTGCKKAYVPKSNVDQWVAKFRTNVNRDALSDRALQEMGWRVIIVWECILAGRKMCEVVDCVAAEIEKLDTKTVEIPHALKSQEIFRPHG